MPPKKQVDWEDPEVWFVILSGLMDGGQILPAAKLPWHPSRGKGNRWEEFAARVRDFAKARGDLDLLANISRGALEAAVGRTFTNPKDITDGFLPANVEVFQALRTNYLESQKTDAERKADAAEKKRKRSKDKRKQDADGEELAVLSAGGRARRERRSRKLAQKKAKAAALRAARRAGAAPADAAPPDDPAAAEGDDDDRDDDRNKDGELVGPAGAGAGGGGGNPVPPDGDYGHPDAGEDIKTDDMSSDDSDDGSPADGSDDGDERAAAAARPPLGPDSNRTHLRPADGLRPRAGRARRG